MTIGIALAFALLSYAGQDLATYTNNDLNITFRYPKSWKVVKKKGYEATFTIPIEGGNPATLDLNGVVFYSAVDQWESSQTAFAKTQKQEVIRQWREDLLGVPWLTIRTEWKEGDVARTRMSGLMYAAIRKKALYHLVADSATFDKAEEQLRGAFSTLAMLDGKVPLPEDPTREKLPEELKPNLIPIVIRDRRATDFIKSPVKILTKSAGLDVALHLPAAWTSERVDAETVLLKRPGVSGVVRVKVLSTLDSDPAERALIKASAESGKLFSSVEKREDRRIPANRAGARVWTTWRAGPSGEGTIVITEAVGATKDFYWLLSGQWGSEQAYRKDAKAIETLIQEMSVELPS